MPFVKMHVSSRCPFDRKTLVRDIRRALVEALEISPDHGHVVLYESSVFSRSTHETRSADFVIAEILMFPGRTDEKKGRLFKLLNEIIHARTNVPEKDIILVIIESGRDNWAVRGGVPVSTLDLGY